MRQFLFTLCAFAGTALSIAGCGCGPGSESSSVSTTATISTGTMQVELPGSVTVESGDPMLRVRIPACGDAPWSDASVTMRYDDGTAIDPGLRSSVECYWNFNLDPERTGPQSLVVTVSLPSATSADASTEARLVSLRDVCANEGGESTVTTFGT